MISQPCGSAMECEGEEGRVWLVVGKGGEIELGHFPFLCFFIPCLNRHRTPGPAHWNKWV